MITQTTIAGQIHSTSSPELSWRLVHNGNLVLNLFEANGYTSTVNALFTGTEAECRAEIVRLNLVEVVAPEA